MIEKPHLFKVVRAGFVVLLFIVGCIEPSSTQTVTLAATPTIHYIFADTQRTDEGELERGLMLEGTVTVAPLVEQTAVAIVANTAEQGQLLPLPTLTPHPTISRRVVTLYGDSLHENWTLENSYEMEYDPQEEIIGYNGRYSLAVTPRASFGKLMFTVSQETSEEYLHENILGFRFWLYSEEYIGTEDLGVTIVGSNNLSYWVENDNSVRPNDNLEVFIPTRLYFLNVAEDITPQTWFQVEVWLDNLIFDPDYRYVTGFIIENDEGFLQTFYVDDVEMIVQVP